MQLGILGFRGLPCLRGRATHARWALHIYCTWLHLLQSLLWTSLCGPCLGEKELLEFPSSPQSQE